TQEMLVRPARAQEESLGSLDRAHEDVERAVAVGVERDGGAAVGLEIESVEKCALLEEGSARRGASAVAKVTVALDPGHTGAFAIERLRARDVIVPVGQRLPPELELDVAVASVSPHSVGRVNVGPAVIVEVRSDRAPVPARMLRAGPRRRVLERVVGLLDKKRI